MRNRPVNRPDSGLQSTPNIRALIWSFLLICGLALPAGAQRLGDFKLQYQLELMEDGQRVIEAVGSQIWPRLTRFVPPGFQLDEGEIWLAPNLKMQTEARLQPLPQFHTLFYRFCWRDCQPQFEPIQGENALLSALLTRFRSHLATRLEMAQPMPLILTPSVSELVWLDLEAELLQRALLSANLTGKQALREQIVLRLALLEQWPKAQRAQFIQQLHLQGLPDYVHDQFQLLAFQKKEGRRTSLNMVPVYANQAQIFQAISGALLTQQGPFSVAHQRAALIGRIWGHLLDRWVPDWKFQIEAGHSLLDIWQRALNMLPTDVPREQIQLTEKYAFQERQATLQKRIQTWKQQAFGLTDFQAQPGIRLILDFKTHPPSLFPQSMMPISPQKSVLGPHSVIRYAWSGIQFSFQGAALLENFPGFTRLTLKVDDPEFVPALRAYREGPFVYQKAGLYLTAYPLNIQQIDGDWQLIFGEALSQ